MAKEKKSSFRGKVARNAQKAKSKGSSYGYLNLPRGVNMFNPEPGSRVKLDFIPYIISDPKHPDLEEGILEVGDLWYKRPFKIHRNIGATNDSAICPTSIGKRCPICEYRAKRIKEGAEKEELDALRTSDRNLYAVIPIDHKKFEETIHLFDISDWLFQKLLQDELEEDESMEEFPDLVNGYTLKIRFESRTIGKGQAFSDASRIDFLKRSEAYDEEDIMSKVPDLDKILQIFSYKELEAKFLELEDEEDGGAIHPVEEDDEEDVSAKPVRRKKAVEEDDEDDDEEDEKPVKPTRRKKSTPVEEEDDDEEDDEDDDEEDEKPVKSVRRKKKPIAEDEDDEDTPSFKESKKGGKEKCPHGHRFGIDAEDFEECDECALWESCIEEKEK